MTREKKTVWVRDDSLSENDKKTKTIWTGMNKFDRTKYRKHSMGYIREQIDRPVPSSLNESSLNEQTTTHLHLEK